MIAVATSHHNRNFTIRRALDYVQKTYPSVHPLLSESFLTDGKDLFVKKILRATGEEQTINVSSWGQLGLGPISICIFAELSGTRVAGL